MKKIEEKTYTIICIEGLDGAGKTVQTNLLKNYIQNTGSRVEIIDFPQYDSFFGKEIGNYLSGKTNIDANNVDIKSMCLWYAADRWKKMSGINMESIDYLILNRYTLSNAVYQCARNYKNYNQEFVDWVFKLEHQEFFLPIPDIYLILDIDPKESKKNNLLKDQREYLGKDMDVYENSNILQINAREIYINISNYLENVKIINCMDNDEILSIEQIFQKIIKELNCYGIPL